MGNSELPTSIQVRFAGVPVILLNGDVRKTFRSRRALGLLAYLVCQRQSIPRAELVDLLWPDKDEDKGRGNLRWAASYLSNLIPGCLKRTRQSIQFANGNEAHTVDIMLLENALEEGNVEVLAELLPHMQGEFMQGVYFDESAEFESWVISQRERIRQQVADAFIIVVRQLATVGQYERALSFAQQWVMFAPWDEQANQLTMELLARLGRIKAAIKQYQTFHQTVGNELESEPSAEMVALFERLQQTTMRTSSTLLTQQRDRFVGRTSELTTVHEYRIHKTDPDRIIIFTGEEGCGKTRLAHAIVDEDPFLARKRLIAIDAQEAKTPEHLAEIVLEALLLADKVKHSTRIQDILAYIEIILHNRNIILLLDGVPNVQELTATLQSWVCIAPQVTILITSRQPCQVVKGKVVPLKGLSQDSAVQLFTELCEKRPFGFQMQTNDMPHVRTICRRLANNPRALLLTATLVDTMRCEEIAAKLKAWINEPTTPTEQAAMMVWETLLKDEKEMLQRLALFDGGFTLQSAEKITGIGWHILKRLADRSLLRTVDEEWYMIPAALKKLIITDHPLPKPEQLYADYAEYMVKLLETTEDEGLIVKMQPHIHATWRSLVDQKRTDLLRKIAIPYANMLDNRSRWRLGYEMFQYAVEQFQNSQKHKMIQPFLWYGYGLFAFRLREIERARHNMQVANKAIKGSKEPIAAIFPFQLGIIEKMTNNYNHAYQSFIDAYETAHTVNNSQISHRAMLHLLDLSFWMGEREQIDRWSVDTKTAGSDILTQYHIWLGYFALARGAYDEAAVQIENAQRYITRIDSDVLGGELLQLRGSFHTAQEKWHEAEHYLNKALTLKRSANAPESFVYCEIARLKLLRSDPNGAQPIADKAFSIAHKSDDLIGRVYSLVILGNVQIELNQMDRAAGTLLNALAMSKAAGLKTVSMHALGGLAKVAWYAGNYALADRLIIGIMHSPYTHQETSRQLPPFSTNSLAAIPTTEELIDEMLVQ